MSAEPTARPQGTCIIVHENVIVAEDLREALMAEGANNIVIGRDVSQLGAQSPMVAFIAGQVDQVIRLPEVMEWRGHGAQIVVMPGFVDDVELQDGIHILEQPFRSEQATGLIQKLKLF
ncbi:hypothetical protein [Hasllibacter sp. MH4015]|uniref:hypothetical protein n=1 Tax=Hasllibacter sp. MH4015 TaxID=2854029 RepID=UPI001CD3883E|nr:hypothetical protein [Hasllibacter sp. MH4015]